MVPKRGTRKRPAAGADEPFGALRPGFLLDEKSALRQRAEQAAKEEGQHLPEGVNTVGSSGGDLHNNETFACVTYRKRSLLPDIDFSTLGFSRISKKRSARSAGSTETDLRQGRSNPGERMRRKARMT